jgi:hypothetical protein
MFPKSRLVALAAMLGVAACSPDTASAPTASPTALPASLASTPPEATPVKMTIFPNEIVADGTNTATARVDVASTVACCDQFLEVSSSNPAVLPFLPTGTTVSAGAPFAGITIDPSKVTVRTVVTIFATGNGVTVSADVTLDPAGTVIAPKLLSYTVNPASVTGATVATGTVNLVNAAPAGGFVVNLASRQPSVASVPSTVTVPAGATSVSFPVTTFADFPNSTTCVRLFALSSTDEVESEICIFTPGTNEAPSLFSLTLGSSSVAAGTSTVGTVALTAAAPSGGSVVSLSSANSSVASIPATVTVPAGAFSASFPINTGSVSSTTTVNLAASFAGSTLSTPLTVTAASTTPPPSSTLSAPTLLAPSADRRFSRGANIAFDWSDVAGAARYEIQIDDQDKFSGSLILDQNVLASQFATSALPTTRMYWRVRAISSSGIAGSWSAVRRFEIK